MRRLLHRWALAAEDHFRYSPLLRGVLRRYRLLRDRVPDGSDPQAVARSLARLCSIARLANGDAAMLAIEERIGRRVKLLDGRRIDWREFSAGVDGRRIIKAAILKAPTGPREKGVLFVSFEEEWTRLVHHGDLRDIAARYDLVVAPTWSPPHCLATTAFAHAWPGPLFSLISNTRDLEILPRLAPNYVPVPLFASSWVNPSFYQPLPRDARDVDVVMVANFGKYKRHRALFRALRGMSRRPRVLLVGQEQNGRTADTLRAEADAYGVRDAVTIRTNVTNEEVAHSLCRARVSLILSRREGSCVAVAESLFADTPVGLLRGAEVGSRAFLNGQTGCFLDERNLAADLASFLAESGRYAPRAWAEQHISCFHSSARLNEILEQHALSAGQEWTCDLAPVCWRPDPVLVHEEDRRRLRAAYDDFQSRYGLAIGRPPHPQPLSPWGRGEDRA